MPIIIDQDGAVLRLRRTPAQREEDEDAIAYGNTPLHEAARRYAEALYELHGVLPADPQDAAREWPERIRLGASLPGPGDPSLRPARHGTQAIDPPTP